MDLALALSLPLNLTLHLQVHRYRLGVHRRRMLLRPRCWLSLTWNLQLLEGRSLDLFLLLLLLLDLWSRLTLTLGLLSRRPRTLVLWRLLWASWPALSLALPLTVGARVAEDLTSYISSGNSIATELISHQASDNHCPSLLDLVTLELGFKPTRRFPKPLCLAAAGAVRGRGGYRLDSLLLLLRRRGSIRLQCQGPRDAHLLLRLLHHVGEWLHVDRGLCCSHCNRRPLL